jgi:branched-subunit amino acid aminotransferase/4-amino-4-deoxychorismate lyase
MQLIERAGSPPSTRAPVNLADLPSFDAAFVTNARGVAPVAAIDDVTFATSSPVLAAVARAYASAGWDRV